MTPLRDIPLTFVVLDIIQVIDDANWYKVEMRVPGHKNFSGFAYVSVREILWRLKQEGYVSSEGDGPMPTLNLTPEGKQLHEEILQTFGH